MLDHYIAVHKTNLLRPAIILHCTINKNLYTITKNLYRLDYIALHAFVMVQCNIIS